MSHDLERFVDAQRDVYDDAIDELANGCKTSHWMWFVFPQIEGLGRSAMSQRFAITSLEEARAYVAHPVLGVRLRECANVLLATEDLTADEIFGSIDGVKLRSSMTLFHRAAPGEPAFTRVLERYFDGVPDPRTDALLSERPS